VTPEEENPHLRRQINELQRRLAQQTALPARLSRRSSGLIVRTTGDLAINSYCECQVQYASYTMSGPTVTGAQWHSAASSQVITAYEMILEAAGYASGTQIPSGTLARIEQDPRSGIYFFTDYYTCPASTA